MTKALRENDIKEIGDIEHVLLRPSIYLGSITEERISTFIFEDDKIVQKDLLQIPGLSKIIDEIIDNAVDESIRTKFKYANTIKVSISKDDGSITVEDNGRGLPIEQNAEGIWTPEIIYTRLRAGSNFNDDGRSTIGLNGLGSTLSRIYSTSFEIDSANGKKSYKQDLTINRVKKPSVGDSTKNYTWVKFRPNYELLKASFETRGNLIRLIEKRLKTLAFAFPEIKFHLNDEKITGSNLKKFLEQIHTIYEMNETDNARLGIFFSDNDFQQISFVNGAETKRGGTHIKYITDTIIEHIRVFIKKKHKLEVNPADIRNKLFVMFSLRMTNAQFDGQTKERLMSPLGEIKSIIDEVLNIRLLNSITKNEEIIAPIVEAYRLKVQVKENLELKKLGKSGKVKVDKYFPATKQPKYLMLCEGDSAMNPCKAILGRDVFSYFAMKGKPLNTQDMTASKIVSNAEIENIVKILNLNLIEDQQLSLSHEYICIASDADLDGAHVAALLLAFFNKFAPSLIKSNRIKRFNTPIIVGKRGDKIVKYFFTLNEYSDYMEKHKTDNITWEYIKGIGSWLKENLKAIIEKEGIDRMIQNFDWDETTSDRISDWLSKDKSDVRKEYIKRHEFDGGKI